MTEGGGGDILRLHRTKCSALIKAVIAPSLLRDFIIELGDSPFSIILDESTDVSTDKLLCICIKFYSKTKNAIVTQFLTFLSVVQATAENMYNAVFEFFSKNNINLNNLIGIGTDGANSLCGKNHSFFTLCKTNLKLPNLVLVKCICHSLHLCASKASEVFKDEVDFLLKETYNWFKNSALRKAKYKEIFDLININSNENKFFKLTQLSSTRWLSRYKAVEKILAQYLELETFFSINCLTEKCHTAKLLSESYKKKVNKLILQFLVPILKQVYYLNLYFQKNDIDHNKSYNDVIALIWSLAGQILKPSLLQELRLQNDINVVNNSLKYENNFAKLEDCDFGYYFNIELTNTNLPEAEVTELKQKCLAFIKRLIEELCNRMPSNLDLFSKSKLFSPEKILNHKRSNFTELPLQLANPNSISNIEIQYRNLLNMDWGSIFEGKIPDNAIQFWQKVQTLKNAAGDLLFEDISLFAFTVLSLPSSNAVVERVFSIMNIVKCKLRNKMLLQMLNSVLFIKYHLYINNICCKSFESSQDMISRFTSDMYKYEGDLGLGQNSELEDAGELIRLCS